MIDMSKKYKTRDGRDVRIYAVDGGGTYPVHGAYKTQSGWRLVRWSELGSFDRDAEHDCDLIEVKPERWYPVYKYPHCDDFFLGKPQPSQAEAMDCRDSLGIPIAAWKAPA